MHHNKHNNNNKEEHCDKCSYGRFPNRPHQPSIIIPPCPPPDVIVTSGIISLNPSQGPLSGGNTIIINGYNLIHTKNVSIGGTNVSFILLSNNQLQIIAPPNSTGGKKIVNVTVQFQNGYSESLPYAYVDGPTIGSLTPSSGPITGSNIITITGINLASTVSVYFNNIITYNFVVISDTTLHVAVPNLTGESNVSVHVVSSIGSTNNLPYNLISPPII